jgi:hypothetical protein
LSYEGTENPFSATVTVDDEASAVKICKNWRKNCTKASEELIKILSGE